MGRRFLSVKRVFAVAVAGELREIHEVQEELIPLDEIAEIAISHRAARDCLVEVRKKSGQEVVPSLVYGVVRGGRWVNLEENELSDALRRRRSELLARTADAVAAELDTAET